MIFMDDTPIACTTPAEEEAFVFECNCASLEGLSRRFHNTFDYIATKENHNYTDTHLEPYRQALLIILLELRIRQYEVDYDGNIYKTPYIIPIPKEYERARLRQIQQLKHMSLNELTFLCQRTVSRAAEKANKGTKL